VLACFSFKVLLFSSNSFNLGAISLKFKHFSFSEKGFATQGDFSSETWYFPLYGKKASHSQE
jgi:hypothetical protein